MRERLRSRTAAAVMLLAIPRLLFRVYPPSAARPTLVPFRCLSPLQLRVVGLATVPNPSHTASETHACG